MSELLIGAGSNHTKRINTRGSDQWEALTTLDINPDHKPDIVHDLESLPYPFLDNSFDEIHAYEVLEHIGRQGDYKAFFAQFSEFWRILKPNGLLCATVPHWKSAWAWGDPSHKRVINSGTLIFLSQTEYPKQVGNTGMSDFRYLYKADFVPVMQREIDNESFIFVLKAVKHE